MTNPIDTTFREDIAKRIAEMKARNKEGKNHFRDAPNMVKSPSRLEKETLEIFAPKQDNIVDVEVKVPLIKNGRPFFNLNKRFVEKALREGKLMRLTWPEGSALHKPEEWLKGEPYQKEFKFAGQPMEMVGSYLDLDE